MGWFFFDLKKNLKFFLILIFFLVASSASSSSKTLEGRWQCWRRPPCYLFLGNFEKLKKKKICPTFFFLFFVFFVDFFRFFDKKKRLLRWIKDAMIVMTICPYNFLPCKQPSTVVSHLANFQSTKARTTISSLTKNCLRAPDSAFTTNLSPRFMTKVWYHSRPKMHVC